MSDEPTQDGTDHDVWAHEAFRAGSAAQQPGEHVDGPGFPTADPNPLSFEEKVRLSEQHARAWPPRCGS